MAYDFTQNKGNGRLTLNNQIVRVIIDALIKVSPDSAKYDHPCQMRNGSPPPGMWCPDKFSDNSGRWVRPDEVRCIMKIIDHSEAEIDSFLQSNNELEYKPFLLEFRNFCAETLPPDGVEDRGHGFQVK
jgi:hypothetical protein